MQRMWVTTWPENDVALLSRSQVGTDLVFGRHTTLLSVALPPKLAFIIYWLAVCLGLLYFRSFAWQTAKGRFSLFVGDKSATPGRCRNYRRLPKMTRRFLKVLKDHPKVFKSLRGLPKITRMFPKVSDGNRKLPEDLRLFRRFPKVTRCPWKFFNPIEKYKRLPNVYINIISHFLFTNRFC